MDRATEGRFEEARGGWELLLEFDARRGLLRSSLRESLRSAIQEGRLAAGTLLPASRRLAADLGVSRGVVSDAYDQLTCEGYLAVRPRSAPVVATVAAGPPPPPEPASSRWRFDFTATAPEVGLFPRREWLRAVQRALATAPDDALDYGDHRGRLELRTALSRYLARVRGVRAEPGHIVITQGFTQALDLLCHVLAERGRDTVAVESPSHPGLWATVRQSGLTLTGCPVDEQGLRTGDLNADAVVVAPAHQFPTGVVMTPERRIALSNWSRETGGLIIEDDYDAEFRYDRIPVGAIQGLDPEHVAHAGTASKTFAPGLRLGWVSAPHDLAAELASRKSAADSGSPAIDQLALASLLDTGGYEKQVVRIRHVYRRRRDLLMRALGEWFPGLAVSGAAAGMQVLLTLPDSVDDSGLAAAAAERGIGVSALSPLYLDAAQAAGRGLLLGFGRLPEHKVDAAVRELRAVARHTW